MISSTIWAITTTITLHVFPNLISKSHFYPTKICHLSVYYTIQTDLRKSSCLALAFTVYNVSKCLLIYTGSLRKVAK